MAQQESSPSEIELRATSADGHVYSIGSFTSWSIAGPAFVAAQPDSPRWAHSLAGVANRALRLLPRKLKEEPFAVLYVFNSAGKQLCMVWARDRADAERKAYKLKGDIEDGSFDATAYEN